ncbi:hypothetical protein [Streptomyces sp. NPDC004014]
MPDILRSPLPQTTCVLLPANVHQGRTTVEAAQRSTSLHAS